MLIMIGRADSRCVSIKHGSIDVLLFRKRVFDSVDNIGNGHHSLLLLTSCNEKEDVKVIYRSRSVMKWKFVYTIIADERLGQAVRSQSLVDRTFSIFANLHLHSATTKSQEKSNNTNTKKES